MKVFNETKFGHAYCLLISFILCIIFLADSVCDKEKIVDCTDILRPCKKTDYQFGVGESAISGGDSMDSMPVITIVQMKLEKELITYVEEYFTYDWQSFIGEVGGTFGLFLGVSMLTTLFDFIEFLQRSLQY